jgi:DNA topoisomerase-1
LPPDELTLARATEILETPNGDRDLGVDPDTGLRVYLRSGRFGAYVQLGESGSGKDKPQTRSLLRSMDPESMTLQDARRLLALPREVGVDPSDGVAVTAQLGRYGPYVAKGSQSRSLADEEAVFTVTLAEALALLAEPQRRQRRAASAALAELGKDPATGRTITLRDGRFGLYVTDGETNASLRKQDDPRSLTPERAQELLRQRRERGPLRRKAAKRKASVSGRRAKPTARTKTAKRAAKKAAKKTAKRAAKKAAKKPAKKAAKKTAKRAAKRAVRKTARPTAKKAVKAAKKPARATAGPRASRTTPPVG